MKGKYSWYYLAYPRIVEKCLLYVSRVLLILMAYVLTLSCPQEGVRPVSDILGRNKR
jgi:hypothetical protein